MPAEIAGRAGALQKQGQKTQWSLSLLASYGEVYFGEGAARRPCGLCYIAEGPHLTPLLLSFLMDQREWLCHWVTNTLYSSAE